MPPVYKSATGHLSAKGLMMVPYTRNERTFFLSRVWPAIPHH